MKIYYSSINLERWNIFEEVKSIGYIEEFLATKDMKRGDLFLLYVGGSSEKYKKGVYAIGKVMCEPFTFKKELDNICYNKKVVKLQILDITYDNPIISYEDCTKYIHQFRSTHKIDENYYGEIKKILSEYNIGDVL